MGIFENINRRVARLGLGRKVVGTLPVLSLLVALAGVVWLLILPMNGQYRRTYISENALLPAQARTYFRESEWNIVRGYRREVHALEQESIETRTATLTSWLEDVGLKVSRHDWSVEGSGGVQNGTNVYGILHSPRGAQTEAIVIVAPWFNQDGDYNDGGISLLVSLARYFKKWSIWSKNLIFVAPSDSHLALRSWVSAYHTSLHNTAGSIEGALILDYPSADDYFDEIEIAYEGLNGQLPNLDLINTVVEVCKHEGIRVNVQGMSGGFDSYVERATVLFRGVIRQILSGVGLGAGAESFSGWRIDAITLKARGTQGPGDITTFGRVIESTVRSVNNLLEHFHQSFFFYFLMSPRSFVSIGTYLPSAMLIANSFTLMAVYSFVKAGKHDFHTLVSRPVLVFGSVLAGCHLLTSFSLQISLDLLVPVIASTAVGTLTLPLVVPYLLPDEFLSNASLLSLHAMSLIFYGLVLTVIAMLNFSMSFVLGIITLPIAWARPNQSLPNRLVLHTISSPWMGLLLMAVRKNMSFEELLNALVWGWHGLGLWTWLILMGIWLPVWLVTILVSSTTALPAMTEDLYKKKNA